MAIIIKASWCSCSYYCAILCAIFTQKHKTADFKVTTFKELIFIKAIIMAGGIGKRLRPLTSNMPKPLLPVGGIPAIRRITDLLEKHNVDEAVITTGYLAESIERYFASSDHKIKLSFSKEDTPLGTAGGVKAASKLLKLSENEPFLVLSGDAVCEIDLSSAIEYSKSKMADVTILLSHARDPFEYGVVLCNDDGEIIRFIEKPSLSHAFSDTVNTGIYIINSNTLDLIPDNESYDFGSQLFPLLLKSSFMMYGYQTDEYWCDIGDISSYYGANMRYSFGENVICGSCHISEMAEVEASIVMEGATIDSGCRINGAIICSGCIIGKDSTIGKGCVIGSESIIGQGAVLSDGVILDPGSRIPDGLIMQSSTLFSNTAKASELLSGRGIEYKLSSLGGRFPFKLGIAIADAMLSLSSNSGDSSARHIAIGVMHKDGAEERLIYHQLLRGIRAAEGCDSIGLEAGFEAAAAAAAYMLRLDLSVFVKESDGVVSIMLFDSNGLYPHRAFERALISALTKAERHISQDMKSKRSGAGDIKSLNFIEKYYLPQLKASFKATAESVCDGNEHNANKDNASEHNTSGHNVIGHMAKDRIISDHDISDNTSNGSTAHDPAINDNIAKTHTVCDHAISDDTPKAHAALDYAISNNTAKARVARDHTISNGTANNYTAHDQDINNNTSNDCTARDSAISANTSSSQAAKAQESFVRRENMPSLILSRAFTEDSISQSPMGEAESHSSIDSTALDASGDPNALVDINAESENSEEKKAEVEDERRISYSVSENGFELTVCKGDIVLDMPHIIALFINDIIQGKGQDKCGTDIRTNAFLPSPTLVESSLLPLAASLPLAVRRLAFGLSMEYSHCPCDDSENEARALAKLYPYLTDGCFAAVRFDKMLRRWFENGITLESKLSEIPKFSIDLEKYKTRSQNMISVMSKLGAPSSEGVFIKYKKGAVRVTPEGGGYLLSSEAASGEYAKEILDISKKKLAELLGEQ